MKRDIFGYRDLASSMPVMWLGIYLIVDGLELGLIIKVWVLDGEGKLQGQC